MRLSTSSIAASVALKRAMSSSPVSGTPGASVGRTAGGASRFLGRKPSSQTASCTQRCVNVGRVRSGLPFCRRSSIPSIVERHVAQRCSMICRALQRAGSPAGWRATCSAEQPARGAASKSRVWFSRGCTAAIVCGAAGRGQTGQLCRRVAVRVCWRLFWEGTACGDCGSCSV